MSQLRDRIEDFIYREAELLDERRFDEWLKLFTPQGIYWLPIDEEAPRGATASLLYDDAISREERVHRLLQLSSPALAPHSRTVHLVGNVRFDQVGDALQVRTSQVIHEIRGGDYAQAGLGEPMSYVATVHYSLVAVDGEFRIALKKVLLINRDMPMGNLTFIL